MTQSVSFFPLGGGLDLITPAISLKPGVAVAALNYEPVMAGYKRVSGYERFDGHTAPSIAAVARLNFINGNGDLPTAEGDEIYQQTETGVRSAVGYILGAPVITGGSKADGTAIGWMPISIATGTFSEDVGDLFVLATMVASQSGDVDRNPDIAPYDETTLLTEARTILRNRVLQVPGSGPIRGIWFMNGRAYAVRDSEDGTAGVPYYSELGSPAELSYLSVGGSRITVGGFSILLAPGVEGWTPAITEEVLSFTAGTVEPQEGDLLEQGATTASVRRVVLDSGTWGGGTASGRVYLVDKSASFVAGSVSVGGSPVFTVSGDSAVSSFPPNGRYAFVTHNFYGATNLRRVYGVNGVGPAFEFDGDTIVEISTGMADDRPTRIATFRQMLWLSFPGGSLQHSQAGEPRSFDPVLGALEIGIGDDVTDLLPMPDSMAVFGTTSVNMLYGTGDEDFTMQQLTDEAGGLAWTAQRIGQAVYLDNRGLRSLTATPAYGNFSVGTLSMLIEPLLADLRRDGVDPVASLVVRSRSQYWLFFENGAGIVFLFGKKQVEALPVNLGVNVTCAASVEDDGVERIFLGADDGFVYEMNRGVSFDGTEIEYYLRLPYNHFGSPQQLKRAHKVTIDMEATGTLDLSVSVDTDLGTARGEPQTLNIVAGAAAENVDDNELYYASQIETVAEAYLGTAGKNFSLRVSGSSAVEDVHTLTGVTYHVSPRGLRR